MGLALDAVPIWDVVEIRDYPTNNLIWSGHNALTTEFRRRHIDWLIGNSPAVPSSISIGTGVIETDEQPESQTAMETIVGTTQAFSSTIKQAPNVARFASIFTATANGVTSVISEVGLFASGTMIAYARVSPTISKGPTQNLVIYWYIGTKSGAASLKVTAFDLETLTITSSTAVSLTSSIYTPEGNKSATKALVSVKDNSVRYRTDGTAPTTSVGHLVTSGSEIELLTFREISNFKIIATASDAYIDITYSR